MKYICVKNFGKVGFSNQIFQLGFLTWASRILSATPIYLEKEDGPRVNSIDVSTSIFEVGSYDICGHEAVETINMQGDRNESLDSVLQRLRVVLDRAQILVLDGYLQYHLDQLWKWGVASHIRETFMANNRWRSVLQGVRDTIRRRGCSGRSIGVHLRRGDYVYYEAHGVDFTFTIRPNDLKSALNDFIDLNYIKNAQIILVSDDLSWVRSSVQHVDGLILADELQGSAAVNCAQDSVLYDLAILSTVDDLFCSNSSFSTLGAVLNASGGQRLRSSPKGGFVPFVTSNTQVLLARSGKYPFSLP